LSIHQNTQHNKRGSENTNQSTRSSSNSKEKHAGANNNNNENARKTITVTAGESIIQNIRSWSISKNNKVVVKSFAVASTEDIEDFVKPTLLNSLS